MEQSLIEEDGAIDTTIRVDLKTHAALKKLKRRLGVSIKQIIKEAIAEKYPDSQLTKA